MLLFVLLGLFVVGGIFEEIDLLVCKGEGKEEG